MAAPRTLATVPVDELREHLSQSTAGLLGDTIAVTDAQWREPSLLPHWSRGHLATHLARNADGLGRLARNVATGSDQPMYPADRDAEIQAGADRSGLELQEDLDTSAAGLNANLAEIGDEQWEIAARLRDGSAFPARMLVAMRLNEVELHRVDLGVGYTCADIPDEVASWLLEWCLIRLERKNPQLGLRLSTPDGLTLGQGAQEVRGSRQDLLAWLSGRATAGPVEGTDGVEVPAL